MELNDNKLTGEQSNTTENVKTQLKDKEYLDLISNLPEMQEAMNALDGYDPGDDKQSSPTPDNNTQEQADEEEDFFPSSEDKEIENLFDEALDDERLEVNAEESDPKKEKKLWKINRRYYQERDKNQKLLQQLEEMERLHQAELAETLNSGMYHWGKSAYSELERAKENKLKAYQGTDPQAAIEADERLLKAMMAVNEVEKWKERPAPTPQSYNNTNINSQAKDSYNYYPEQNAQNQYQDTEDLYKSMAQDWLEDHPYLRPNSRKYDQALAQKVNSFINNLDAELTKKGKMNLHFSDEYFDYIDKYIDRVRRSPDKIAKNIESASQIGGVRNSVPKAPKQSAELTEEESFIASELGPGAKEYWRNLKTQGSTQQVRR